MSLHGARMLPDGIARLLSKLGLEGQIEQVNGGRGRSWQWQAGGQTGRAPSYEAALWDMQAWLKTVERSRRGPSGT